MKQSQNESPSPQNIVLERFANYSLLVFSIVLTLFFSDQFLSKYIHLDRFDRLYFVGPKPDDPLYPLLVPDADKAKDEGGICYTSDPENYYLIRLQHPESKRDLYCIRYGVEERVQGFFADRKKQAVIIGDSFVFGTGLHNEDTLGYILGQSYREYNFKNYGLAGADVSRVHDQVLTVIEKEKDIAGVIYFYNLNDIFSLPPAKAPEWWRVNDFQNPWISRDFHRDEIRTRFGGGVIARLFMQAYVKFWETRLTVDEYRRLYFDPSYKTNQNQTEKFIVYIDRILQDKKVDLTVVIYPLLYKDWFGRYPFQPIHDLIMDYCRANEIHCVDGIDAFKDYRTMKSFVVHPIDYHPNGRANRLLVNYLAENNLLDLE